MAMIYVVEDDKNIQEIEEYVLKNNGFDVRVFNEGETFFQCLNEIIPDLILLDIMLSGEDGTSILRKIRMDTVTKDIPVIMVSAKSSELDTVKALDQGADDYITKPFGIMELISRVKAMLRRVKPISDEQVLRYKNVVLDQEKRSCFVEDKVVELTYKEYELLWFFMSNIGVVLSRDSIMDSVWDSEYVGESRTVDVHIKTLRKKLGDGGNYIKTIRNVGYKFE